MTTLVLPLTFASTVGATLPGLPQADAEIATLVARSAAGDPGALARLYDRIGADLFAFAAWRSGRRELAEDGVQEFFCRLAAGRVRVPEPLSDARGWLFACVRNALIDGARGAARFVDDGEGNLLSLAAVALPVEDLALLSRAVDRLPAKSREAIYLHLYQGMTFREIGRVVGIPTFTAASRYRLGIRRLEKSWGGGR